MTSTLSSPTALDTTAPLDPAVAFVALALAAVSWDGSLTMAGSRALRHALDYRHPYRDYTPEQMVGLMDGLMATLRRDGPQHLMVRAAEVLNAGQRATAYAVAAEIMRSDGPLEDDERNILSNLAATLQLGDAVTIPVHAAMDLLHADLDMA
ncbi:tellurite resistance TerB family protein [Cyanobium sp. LEGE 06143]|uniref:tellurite resistance TerB family protein n=1 Tax=unclassified Cyanobium TaxID=2627006 RepID=UPI0016496B26|nr:MULTISPECIES: tellurite resistance TerB family protein [unclassified Cyanobium]MBE9171861.1 tellurite resistance TerB family protein [Cyanobium sp. LEGE 06143]